MLHLCCTVLRHNILETYIAYLLQGIRKVVTISVITHKNRNGGCAKEQGASP